MELKRLDDNTWEIPKQGAMRVPAVIYASRKLLGSVRGDKTLEQARNVACLPGIRTMSYVMPDAHQGYGFPIGGVAAFDLDDGIISPGGVGYDINCGVRLLRTDYTEKDVSEKRAELLAEIFKEIPAGVGKGGITKLSPGVLKEILARGAEWAVENGYGTDADLDMTEERGRMREASWARVSDRALERGIPQLGTLGAGNHFLEIQKVETVFDETAARAFGIDGPGQILVMIHCGSRGLGHQVASDSIQAMENARGVAGLPDRELVSVPIRSGLGREYYESMSAAVPTGSGTSSPRCWEARRGCARSTTFATMSPRSSGTSSKGGRRRSASIARERPGASGPDGRSFRAPTARSASRSSFPAAWGRRRTCWRGPGKRRL
jgi:tRNA-splicing ligase RtcB